MNRSRKIRTQEKCQQTYEQVQKSERLRALGYYYTVSDSNSMISLQDLDWAMVAELMRGGRGGEGSPQHQES